MTRIEQARKKQRYDKEKARKAERVEFRGYKKITVTERDKHEFDAWRGSQDVLEMLADVVNGGYKVSVFEDAAQECFVASLYDQNTKSKWAGYILAIRAKDTQTALERLLWFHYVSLSEDWGAEPLQGGGDEW